MGFFAGGGKGVNDHSISNQCFSKHNNFLRCRVTTLKEKVKTLEEQASRVDVLEHEAAMVKPLK